MITILLVIIVIALFPLFLEGIGIFLLVIFGVIRLIWDFIINFLGKK